MVSLVLWNWNFCNFSYERNVRNDHFKIDQILIFLVRLIIVLQDEDSVFHAR